MADLAHLEQMGRELKCPICWSLFTSAISLPCNHIFCNTCIMESMKSASDCPVCKVPFRRREVRAAPHMDNLVSIYKSMEVSAGKNIFSTQMCPPTQTAVVPTDGFSPGNQEKGNITEIGGKSRKRSKRKGSSEMKKRWELETDAKHSPQQSPSKHSFPANERVLGTPYSLSGTPLRHQKISRLEDPVTEMTDNAKSNSHAETALDSVEDPLLSPFFWLRGDDDGSPQKQSSEQIMGTPSSLIAPCFSDLKDSDDEKPTAITPSNKLKISEPDYFDSEMFEWTQRACSPELCSTPQRSPNTAKNRLDKVLQKECQERSAVMATPCAITPHVDDKVGPIGASISILSKKRKCKRNNLSVIKKSSMRNNAVFEDVDVGTAAGLKGKVESSPKSGRKSRKKRPNLGILDEDNCSMSLKKQNNSVMPETTEQSPNLSAKSKELNVGKKMVTDRSCRSIKTNNSKWQRKIMNKSNNVQAMLSKVVYDSASEEEQDQISLIKKSDMSNSASTHIKHGKFSRATGRGEKIQRQHLGKLNICVGKDQAMEPIEGNTSVVVAAASVNTTCETNQTLAKESKMNLCVEITTKNRDHNPENIVLRKCEKSHSQIHCAFCQSSNDTENSGEMMHYFNGKPVASDFNGGANVIHSHKHCTEWAPDVYFEDEIVINLTAEVSRSRRIKCSCCGVKGAALGCYERSCRKSFHYTCAKLMQECKWDTENFVMLCPLHSSMKLPNEVSNSPRQSRKRSIPKGPKVSSQASLASKPCDQLRQMWTWPSGSPCKWVLCCSALSADEKETVARFSKITGAPVSNAWNPEVTHVIASTDGNGAYRRTLKILKGILDGKWILKVDWIKACMEAMEPINEEKYEVTVDVYGISGGPRLGRLRRTNKQPKIFSGLRFFFSGDYSASYKGFLQDLVSAASGTILQRKPISRDHDKLLGDTSTCKTVIVYSSENSEKKHNRNVEAVADHQHSEARALADASGGIFVASTWIIDAIAACQLQPLT